MVLRNFWNWCKRHLLLITAISAGLLLIFGFLNIQILHMTSEPEFCALCHPGQGYGPLAEVDSWEHSGHAAAGVSCLDCHGRPGLPGYVRAKMGGLKDLYYQFTISSDEKLAILSNPRKDLVPGETCLFCHSDQENQQIREKNGFTMDLLHMRLADGVQNPEFRQQKGLPDILTERFVGGSLFDHAFHMESFDLVCADCHFGVVHRQQSKTDRMNLCIVCHAENVGSSAPQLKDCTACHLAQLAMNEGKGAPGISGEPGFMFAANIDCQMCHTGVSKGVYRPSSGVCADCHDGSYAAFFDEWKRDTAAELDRVNRLRLEVESKLREADMRKEDTTEAWESYIRAQANLKHVKDDGTLGIHNRFYAEEILKNAETEFKKIGERFKPAIEAGMRMRQ